jgi:putative transposase
VKYKNKHICWDCGGFFGKILVEDGFQTRLASSNRFMKNHLSMYRNFPDWQVGYGAFTYEFIRKKGLIEYINNQEAHHRKLTFKQELAIAVKTPGLSR